MCITEYDEEKTLRGRYEEGFEKGYEEGFEKGFEEGFKKGFEEGFKKGFEEGRIKTLAELVKDGIITIVQAANSAKMTEEEFIEKAELRA